LPVFIILFGKGMLIPAIMLVLYGFSILFPLLVNRFAELPYSQTIILPAMWILTMIGYPLALGEQVNFVVHAESEGGTCEKIVSLPAYPPQIMTSLVSFASFSTSVMGFMASSTYYESSFGSVDEGLNVGLVISIVLIILLIFLELSEVSQCWRRASTLCSEGSGCGIPR